MTVSSGSHRAAGDYYAALTSLYQWYGGAADGWHYGVYDPGVTTHRDALERSNQILLDGIQPPGLGAVLDVGCGEGGFSVWAASRGYRVIGITVVPQHVVLARSLAASRGVSDHCRFLVMDMDALAVRDDSFDLAVNQETLCHSQDKGAYLAKVWRSLRPGGQFRALDLARRHGSMGATEQRRYQSVLDGFEIASLVSEPELRGHLERAGFVDIFIADLTLRIRRTALLILGFSSGPHLLTTLGIDSLIYPRDDELRNRYRRHVAASVAFNLGLLTGQFRYLYAAARKPI